MKKKLDGADVPGTPFGSASDFIVEHIFYLFEVALIPFNTGRSELSNKLHTLQIF